MYNLFCRATRKLPVKGVTDDGFVHKLIPCLGLSDAISFGVTSTVGSGIFVAVGVIALDNAGSSTFVSFLLAALCCSFSALCFAELSTRYPFPGQSYSYLYASCGELPGFLCGWLCFVCYTVGTAAVSRAFSSYFDTFIHFMFGYYVFPDWVVSSRDSGSDKPYSLSILSGILCVLSTLLSVYGVHETMAFARYMTFFNISLMLSITFYALCCYGDGIPNLVASSVKPLASMVGVRGVLEGTGMAYFCCIGWDMTCSLSCELRNPSRDLPRGLLISLFIVTILYAFIALVFCSLVPNGVLSRTAPIASVFSYYEDNWGYGISSLVAMTVCLSSCLPGLVGPPRILYQMSIDGLIDNRLKWLSSKGVPSNATFVCGFACTFLAIFFKFESLAASTSFSCLLIFMFVSMAVIMARTQGSGLVKRQANFMGLKLSIFGVISLVFFFALKYLSFYFTVFSFSLNCFVFLWICISYNDLEISSSHQLEMKLLDKSILFFHCPGVPYVPLLSCWFNAYISTTLGISAAIGAFVIVILGIVMYLVYGIHHSQLNIH